MNKTLVFSALILTPIVLIAIVASVLLVGFGIIADICTPLVAIGTVELAVVAGLQDWIRRWIAAPKLDIEISAPDFHGTYDNGSKVYYSRFRVHNKGGASAEKVEVILRRVYGKEGQEAKPDDAIPPDNLNWSMIGEWVSIPTAAYGRVAYSRKFIPAIYCEYIAPGTCKHCTLGHIYEPTHQQLDEYGTPRFQVPAGETIFCLEVSFKSNLRYYFLKKGIYRIEIQAACANTKPITKTYEFEVTGMWFENDEMMSEKGFTIHPLEGV